MERWRNGIDRQAPRRCRDCPSFSSTLLDSIYRSIDETDNRGATKEQQRLSGAPDRISTKKQNMACFPESRRIIPSVKTPTVTCPGRNATSSSSDGSSYGSFSSSDTESVSNLCPARLRPIRTTPTVRSGRLRPEDAPDQFISATITEKSSKKERNGSIRNCLRDLRNGRSPSSPGARLANFLGSLFAAKSKVSAELPCPTEPSYSRSCLSKTPSTAKRTVRFCPVSVIVGEDCRPCGEKWVYGGAAPKPPAAPPPPPVRRSKVQEEEDEEDDLFELKNLAVIGRFRDELPVYETTLLGKYSGVSRGLIL
ncbi:hypothetical protein KFK09_005635 [Dendrobium nobile]|uniref:Uncharacterized protein n=1 Tax=Dendrobium nobile TaxID=94219 RepID=A0A8T3BYX2_DENNO|nr:hypothetical protein KFK09_005635 [Dendrobium nobile]